MPFDSEAAFIDLDHDQIGDDAEALIVAAPEAVDLAVGPAFDTATLDEVDTTPDYLYFSGAGDEIATALAAIPLSTARGGTASNGKTSYTIDQAANQLTRTNSHWGSGVGYQIGQPVTVTYAFRANAPTLADGVTLNMPDDTGGFSQFNAAQIAAAELSLKAWSDVANITFQRVGSGTTGPDAYSDNASILFGNYATGASGAAAFAYYPSVSLTSRNANGDVWVNSTLSYNINPTLYNYGQQTLTHELGHAIGLSHPADYDASDGTSPTYTNSAIYYEDSRQYTVMSYFSVTSTGANYNGYYASAPQLDDIAAAQRLYGANMTTRTGDTVYGFNSNADRPWFQATSASGPLIFAVWDAGGNDTFDFSGFTQGGLIDLRAGNFSSVGGMVGNIAIAKGVVIENALGGAGAELMYGNSAANTMKGGGGDDIIHGDAGNDYLAGNMGNDTLYGEDGNDTLQGGPGDDILYGGADGDTLIGADGNDKMYGEDGDDWADGGIGDDVIDGGAGNDVITGNDGNDTLYGGDGNDIIDGATGNDTIDGGAGRDNLFGSDGDDTIHGGADGDFIVGGVGSDSLYGDDGADFIMGGDGGDVIDGGTGDDLIAGEAGNDNLSGGDGADFIDGGAGNDTINGGAGVDTIYGGDGDDVVHGGDDNDTLNGGIGNDSLYGDNGDDFIAGGDGDDGIIGGAGNDVLYGEAGRDTIFGGDGNDIIDGGADNDTLIGEAGNDQLYGGDGDDVLHGGADNDTLIGGAGADQLFGEDGDDYLSGQDGNDVIDAGEGNDVIDGGAGSDIILGGGGSDIILGGDGDDTITGGAGRDYIYGGSGADHFIYAALTDSTTAAPDVIYDFNAGEGDVIDLSQIDADANTAGKQSFHFVTGAFTNHAGEALLTYDAGSNTTALSLDVNGDGVADFKLIINGNVSGSAGFNLGTSAAPSEAEAVGPALTSPLAEEHAGPALTQPVAEPDPVDAIGPALTLPAIAVEDGSLPDLTETEKLAFSVFGPSDHGDSGFDITMTGGADILHDHHALIV